MFPTIKLNIERWKYNPTFELYVSNMGHIRNKSKADIAPKVAPSGYLTVKVHGSINAYMLLHRVVMLTWKPTPEAEELTVDHLDHNKRNNALSNLEWVVAAENMRRAREDLITAKEVIDHHFVAVDAKSKKIGHFVLTTNASQYGALDREYHFADYEAMLSFLKQKRSEGHACLNWLGSKAEVKMRNKLHGLLNGGNTTGQIKYMGLNITPVFDEPAAE